MIFLGGDSFIMMVALRKQLFASYLERNIFDVAHPRHLLANFLHNPSHIQSTYHPNFLTAARTSQDVCPPSFACVSVWDAPRVVHFLVISAKRREDCLLSLLPRVAMGGWHDCATLPRDPDFCEAFQPKRTEEMRVAPLRWHG
jgi:hypothetical protein